MTDKYDDDRPWDDRPAGDEQSWGDDRPWEADRPGNEEPLDEWLRDEFGRLRSETEGSARVPEFRAMLEKAKADAAAGVAVAASPELRVVRGGGMGAQDRRRRVVRIGGWASVALAAAIAGVLLVGRPSDADREFERLVAAYSADAAAGAWRSPTSALLNVPGMNLTRSVPSFGDSGLPLDPDELPNVPDADTRDL